VDVLLDGLLGTGISLPLRPPAGEFLRTWKNLLPLAGHIVAVDCPSGIDCDSGAAADETLPADLTVTMAAPKAGLYQFPAAGLVGELQVAGIGLPDGLPAWDRIRRRVVDPHWVSERLPARPPDAHKGTFGTVTVVAGSENYVGAALLSGQAAFRSGAGLVTLACSGNVYRLLAGHFPEATWLPLPDSGGSLTAVGSTLLRLHLERTTSILLGPGLGLADSTAQFVSSFLGETDSLPPLVIDADGLKLLARIPEWHKRLPPETVLTPHPGEMSVLTGLASAEIQQNRLQVAEHWAARWGHVLVLKGANTLIAAPDGFTALVPVATAALAKAGTGDVLAGLIAGLRGQRMDAFQAAACGAWLHAMAGLRAQEKFRSSAAVLAGDVLASLGDVIGELPAQAN
jgi:NAD(P)H-hydrate epimerase